MAQLAVKPQITGGFRRIWPPDSKNIWTLAWYWNTEVTGDTGQRWFTAALTKTTTTGTRNHSRWRSGRRSELEYFHILLCELRMSFNSGKRNDFYLVCVEFEWSVFHDEVSTGVRLLSCRCFVAWTWNYTSVRTMYLKKQSFKKPEHEGTLSVTQSINGFLTGPTKHRRRGGGGPQTLHKEVQSDHSRHKMTRRLCNMSSKRHKTRERRRITMKSVCCAPSWWCRAANTTYIMD